MGERWTWIPDMVSQSIVYDFTTNAYRGTMAYNDSKSNPVLFEVNWFQLFLLVQYLVDHGTSYLELSLIPRYCNGGVQGDVEDEAGSGPGFTGSMVYFTEVLRVGEESYFL
jgi:hypothetical protein